MSTLIELGEQDKPAVCPACTTELGYLSSATNGARKADIKLSYTLCSCCSSVLRFNEDGTLRLATNEDLDNLPDRLLCDLVVGQFKVTEFRIKKEIAEKAQKQKSWRDVNKVPDTWR